MALVELAIERAPDYGVRTKRDQSIYVIAIKMGIRVVKEQPIVRGQLRTRIELPAAIRLIVCQENPASRFDACAKIIGRFRRGDNDLAHFGERSQSLDQGNDRFAIAPNRNDHADLASVTKAISAWR